MKLFSNLLKYWLPVVIWAGLIFYLSSLPSLSSGLGVTDLILRKLAHMFEFGLLAWLLYRALFVSLPLDRFNSLAWALILTFIYAVSDEFHQLFVFGREGRFTDVLIDSLGILVFVLILAHENNRKSQTQIKGQ